MKLKPLASINRLQMVNLGNYSGFSEILCGLPPGRAQRDFLLLIKLKSNRLGNINRQC